MSRIEELKKQNPSFSINYIDVITESLPNSRYTEMVVNILKNEFKKDGTKRYKDDIVYELTKDYGISESKLKKLSFLEVHNFLRFLNDHIGRNNFQDLLKFIELNERKLIANNDLTTYKNFDELSRQNSLSELKLMDKELEVQVQKLHDGDEWLVVKPLSYLSSLKYGAGTKWCTASSDNPDYYLKYARLGILIYCINKKSGNKVAAFKSLDYDKEVSFWDIKDQRIDSIESGLPNEVMDVIRFDFSNGKTTNWDFLNEEEKNAQLISIENERRKEYKLSSLYSPVMSINNESDELTVRQEISMEEPPLLVNMNIEFRSEDIQPIQRGIVVDFNGNDRVV